MPARRQVGRGREVKCLMKHVKVLSGERPACGAITAWVQLKDIIGIGRGLNRTQAIWLASQIDNWLQK